MRNPATKPFITAAFDHGHMHLQVNDLMRSQARTVALVMDELIQDWDGRAEEVFRSSNDYRAAFALLLKYAASHNPSLQIHRVDVGSQEAGVKDQFKDNMKLLIVDELGALVKSEAEKLRAENPTFIEHPYYAPHVRTADGYIPRVEANSPPGERPVGTPVWAAKSFATDVFSIERQLHEVVRSMRHCSREGNGRA